MWPACVFLDFHLIQVIFEQVINWVLTKQVGIGQFFIWLVKTAARLFLDQSQSEVRQNQSNVGSLSILNRKLLYSCG